MIDTDLDLIWLSLLIFLPSAFALVLLFFPKGTEEYMRWWTLLGTAATFVVSAVVFINYLGMLDRQPDPDFAKRDLRRPAESTSLAERTAKATEARAKNERIRSDDLLGRYPWISRFNIDYFVGIDGISMPLVLLTTVITFLSMIASWGIDKHV